MNEDAQPLFTGQPATEGNPCEAGRSFVGVTWEDGLDWRTPCPQVSKLLLIIPGLEIGELTAFCEPHGHSMINAFTRFLRVARGTGHEPGA